VSLPEHGSLVSTLSPNRNISLFTASQLRANQIKVGSVFSIMRLRLRGKIWMGLRTNYKLNDFKAFAVLK
jgi:hypothetical protein